MKEKVSIVSGGFDPLHVGHIELINRAREISDGVIVILNTDEFLIKKKGKPFMKFEERKIVLENLKNVSVVITELCVYKCYGIYLVGIMPCIVRLYPTWFLTILGWGTNGYFETYIGLKMTRAVPEK